MTCLRWWGKFRFQWICLSLVLAVLLWLIGPKTLAMLGPLPEVNQSRKYLRTFLCHRIPFCPFSSSPFLAKRDMYKSLSLPSGVDSASRSCITKREKWLEIHITAVPSTIKNMIQCFRQTTRTLYDRNCRQPEAKIGNVPWLGNSMDTNLIKLKNIVIRDF